MTDYVIPPPAQASLAVHGQAARFPIHRVFCIGRNYPWTAGEPRPRQMPGWFMKPATAVVPAEGALPYPPQTADFCHEVELVAAIGRAGQDIAPADGQHHIWGYALGLDMTRRDLQQQAKREGGSWEPAKAFDHSAPCSPLRAAADIGHPEAGAIWLSVNDTDRQRSDLAELLWSVPELVAMLSRSVRLLPGDLVFTGTPAGVGPLLRGDTLRAGIEGIAEISMQIR
ncbi:FAA hydrolase family protein [Xylophilus rhododendri]|uniref:FAA hydrolase family protein n=1 Tax=Xylophilus rhododendri TaxID=2697032 RepID=A0A857JB51_9BURK|nr:fumarylacetoacetate hydrolase family protein [Xylophilus rhododendri]QHJ00918.1 FAA hydrolase family protein [Xylophilus rhododendri]